MVGTPRCHTRGCIHLIGIQQKDMVEDTEVVICLAFPTGIPDEIAFGDNLHGQHFEGQTGNFIYTKRGSEGEGGK